MNSWIQDWGSILHFTNDGGNCCNIGQRIPAVWTKKGAKNTLYISTAIGANGNAPFDVSGIPTKKWFLLTMSQYEIVVYISLKVLIDISDFI